FLYRFNNIHIFAFNKNKETEGSYSIWPFYYYIFFHNSTIWASDNKLVLKSINIGGIFLGFLNLNNVMSMEFRNDHIRVVVGKVHNNNFDIKKYFIIEIPEKLYENGEILDFAQLSYIIKRNLEINKIKVKKTHVLLDSDKIIIREITIPTVNEN